MAGRRLRHQTSALALPCYGSATTPLQIGASAAPTHPHPPTPSHTPDVLPALLLELLSKVVQQQQVQAVAAQAVVVRNIQHL